MCAIDRVGRALAMKLTQKPRKNSRDPTIQRMVVNGNTASLDTLVRLAALCREAQKSNSQCITLGHEAGKEQRACVILGDSSPDVFSIRAEVAELADAQASGACGRKVVEVQILSSAPLRDISEPSSSPVGTPTCWAPIRRLAPSQRQTPVCEQVDVASKVC